MKSVNKETDRAGQALIGITLGITVIFGLLGMVVDVGYSYYMKQVTQAAADSAALSLGTHT